MELSVLVKSVHSRYLPYYWLLLEPGSDSANIGDGTVALVSEFRIGHGSSTYGKY